MYGLLTALTMIASILPGPLVYGLSVGPALLLYVVTRWREAKLNERGRGVQRNMKIAFGRDLPPAELRRLTWGYCRHMAWLLVEVCRMRLLTERRFLNWVDQREFAVVRELLAEGKGLIVATGHFGNFEVLGMSAGYITPTVTIHRPCPEGGFQRFLIGERERAGQEMISKFMPMGGLWSLRKALKRGHAVGLNVDENTRHGGVFAPFFGVLAATNKSAAMLQRKTGAPIVVLTCPRTRPGRWAAKVWDVIRPEPGPDAAAEELRVTTRVLAGFEQALRADPTQWMWSLRRWETRPEGEALDAEGFPQRV